MKQSLLLIIMVWWLHLPCRAQEIQNATVEQQLELLAEAEEAETEDDSYYQQLQYYRRHPLNLNTATEADLQPLRFLNDLQIHTFLQYRKLLGPLISIHELQAIPGWDLALIERIRPFVRVGPAVGVMDDLASRFRKGEHTILLRVSQTLETAKGYHPAGAQPPPYAGSPQRVMARYKYAYGNLLQFGLLGEKDPGEPFLRGAQARGFDFHSGHLFVRNLGVVKQLAVGDFTLNLGQGLLAYQSLAFRKSADVINIKRQTETLRPYNSPGEANFFRGAGITLGRRAWSFTLAAARQKVSANQGSDTLQSEDYVSSILVNGYHRTAGETADRKNITQSMLAARLQYRHQRIMTAINAVHYRLEKPLQRAIQPYNQYAFRGRLLTGFSGEWSYTWRNLHAFGELAANPSGALAGVAGLMASLDPRVDLSLLYRNLSPQYVSIYASAFTESTTPSNEKGLFAGLSLKPNPTLRVDAYADAYRFPWLRYRIHRPAGGRDYLLQLTWKPNKQVELYSRFRSEHKAINLPGDTITFHRTELVPRQSWRTQLQYRLSSSVTLRTRGEMLWYDRGGSGQEQGFLVFTDLFYKPMMRPLGLNFRLQYFETDGYNSRLYAFENDVLYSFSIPALYDKGYRSYINISYDLARWCTAWIRVARVWYPHRTSIGSGNDEIPGNHRTDVRMQVLIRL